MKRKAISKKTRFDIFKRDGFQCMYCGSAPPKVLLHVDHIVPVKEGGGNEIDNLVTACEGCNLGKAAIKLDVVPQSLADKSEGVAEREAQLKGYHDIMMAKRDRVERETWFIIKMFQPGITSFRRDWFASIKKFVEKLGFIEAEEAMDIALSKNKRSDTDTFKYFCGVCWSKIKEADGK